MNSKKEIEIEYKRLENLDQKISRSEIEKTVKFASIFGITLGKDHHPLSIKEIKRGEINTHTHTPAIRSTGEMAMTKGSTRCK